MSVSDFPIFAALKQQMKWLNANQKVVSQNIANADTPGYVAHEMERQDFSKLVSSLESKRDERSVAAHTKTRLQGSQDGHFGEREGRLPRTDESEQYEVSRDGNAVELEAEMIKSTNNQMEYALTVNLYRKNLGLLKAALGKGR